MSSELEAALAAHLQRWMHQPFVFGTADCVAFTASWIDGQRGTNYAVRVERQFRGLPFREVRLFAEPGRLRAAVTTMLGEPAGVEEVKLGDPVMFDNGEGKETLGVAGETLAYGPDAHGIGALPLAGRVRAVWPLERIA